ncbi:hypothetical protein PV721_28110 [Streptomyces sp. MB09-01]|uniref:hypothetical protein n=1 Tax=Streptomyces sp. MB09-01 TaxID=3028666 RepID=UPI0029B60309|nr:hypothetical protein [Streptomyces sp. MB09-01]MDX3538142.1 hypothetical protein [Streptomyces sp. MB09-01]
MAKHLFYALLTQDTSPGETPISISSIHTYFSCARRFFLWAGSRTGSLADLTAEDLAAYHQAIVGLRQATGSTRRHRRAVRMLWAYRTRLPVSQRLVCDPVRLPTWQAWARPQSRRSGENLTGRIPEQVMAPLLTWALRWVDDFADDVLGARTVRAALDARPAPCPDPLSALARVLAEFRERGIPLPAVPAGADGPEVAATANVTHLARLVGCSPNLLTSKRTAGLVKDAATELGVAGDSYLDHRVRGLLDGRPWLAAISYYDVPRFLSLLQTACWVVIAYLSGMRDSEIKHLQRGCVSTRQDPDGRVYRHELTSLAFKGETDPRGVTATWIVTAPVARAVAVLERLQPEAQAFLFTPAGGRNVTSSRLPVQGRVTPSRTTVTKLAALTTWINDYCATAHRTDRIPHVNGRPPHLTTRQFRRTLAWFIARHPAGAIAGALQFRHQRIQMFEGYAGTSDSGFRAEVEAEESLTRGQYLADTATEPDRPRLTGPAGAEAEQRLTAFARHALFEGQVVTDEARLLRIMKLHDPAIYPGTFVTCVFNPDRALCRPAPGTSEEPELGDCRPLACRNTALTPGNREAHARHLAVLDCALAQGDRLAPYIRHRFQQQRQDTSDFLTRHTPEPT